MSGRAERERGLRAENRRMKAALSAIHNALHAGDVNGAHELCECANEGETVSQPNLSARAAASAMSFAADFNKLAKRADYPACCIMLIPSSTKKNAASVQLFGNVAACKAVEELLRGKESTYMGDHGERTSG